MYLNSELYIITLKEHNIFQKLNKLIDSNEPSLKKYVCWLLSNIADEKFLDNFIQEKELL